MSAYGGPLQADVERETETHCGMRDHTADGDWFDEADRSEPEPFKAPVSLRKVTDTRCTKIARGFSHGSRWVPCRGRLYSDGRCASCGQAS